MLGKIVRLTIERGFGFCQPLDSIGDPHATHFLHAKALLPPATFGDLKIGDVVEFDSELGAKGLMAVNAQLTGNHAHH